MEKSQIGVSSWSLHPANPAELVELLGATGLKQIQGAIRAIRVSPEWH